LGCKAQLIDSCANENQETPTGKLVGVFIFSLALKKNRSKMDFRSRNESIIEIFPMIDN